MAYLSLGNPIWSGQVQLLGGPRKIISRGVVYAAILMVAFAVMRRVHRNETTDVVAGQAIRYLVWMQWGLLLVGGTAAVFKAMMRDHQTRMIESVRIAPLGAPTIIAGYTIGPALSVIVLWLAGLFVGLVLTTACGAGGTREWVLGHLLCLVSAQLVWTMQAFFGVGPGKPAGVVIPMLVIVFILTVADQSIRFAPGLALFTGGFVAMASREVAAGFRSPDAAMAIALFVAAGMLLFWSHALAARFRRPYLPPIGAASAFVMLLLWAACAVIGTINADGLYPQNYGAELEAWRIMGMITAQSMLGFMCLPIAAAALVRRRTLLGGGCLAGRLGRRLSPWPVALLSALSAIGVILWLCELCSIDQHAELVAAAVVGAIAGAAFALGLMRMAAVVWEKTAAAWVLIALAWVMPIIVSPLWDAIAEEVGRPPSPLSIVLFASSPLGGMMAAARGVGELPVAGLAVQVVLAVLALLVARRAERVFVRERALIRAGGGSELRGGR